MAQHWIPRCILKGFLREPKIKNQIWLYNLVTGARSSPNITKAFASTGFYDTPLINSIFSGEDNANIEEWMSKKVEGPVAPVLDKLRSSPFYFYQLTTVERVLLMSLVALQYLRSPAYRKRSLEIFDSLGIEREAEERPDELHSELINLGIVELPLIVRALFHHDLYLYTSGDNEFLIGDDPLTINQHYDYNLPTNVHIHHWIGLIGSGLWLPISNDVCLHLYYNPENNVKRPGEIMGVHELPSGHVDIANRHQLENARRFIANSSGNFDKYMGSNQKTAK